MEFQHSLETISFKIKEETILTIDKDGLHYKGQLIEDAGKAHRLMIKFLKIATKEEKIT